MLSVQEIFVFLLVGFSALYVIVSFIRNLTKGEMPGKCANCALKNLGNPKF